jgi:hypothetical protein
MKSIIVSDLPPQTETARAPRLTYTDPTGAEPNVIFKLFLCPSHTYQSIATVSQKAKPQTNAKRVTANAPLCYSFKTELSLHTFDPSAEPYLYSHTQAKNTEQRYKKGQ